MSRVPQGRQGKQEILLLRNQWRLELRNALAYELLARREPEARRREILLRLAAAERTHADRCRRRLEELGARVPRVWGAWESLWQGWRFRFLRPDQALRELEAQEQALAREPVSLKASLGSGQNPSWELLREIAKEEEGHATLLGDLLRENEAQGRLTALLQRERWHRRGSDWVADAIYGANDGLGAVFGIISGVAGATANQEHYVILSGLAGMLASRLSMGAGAYLAAKSQRELLEAEIAREKEEIEQNPQEEKEELALFYELQGVPSQQAQELAERMIQRPDAFLEVMLQNELGLAASQLPNPWVSLLSATFSTALGAFVPLIPFFCLHGTFAVATSFAVSLAAHFAIGAAKSLVTLRSWWASGLEMTLVGVLEAIVTYSVGKWFGGFG